MIASSDEQWMRRALNLAAMAAEKGEVPVGAVVVINDQEVGAGYNAPITDCDPTAHAEIRALRDAARRVGNYRLSGATLYVTLEPCTMCAGAIVHSRIGRVVFAAREPKAGVAESVARIFDSTYLNWRVQVEGGVLEDEASRLLSSFFSDRRQQQRGNKAEK